MRPLHRRTVLAAAATTTAAAAVLPTPLAWAARPRHRGNRYRQQKAFVDWRFGMSSVGATTATASELGCGQT